MATKFRDDGSYQFRVPPGKNFVLFYASSWTLVRPAYTSDPNSPAKLPFDRSITISVDEGETIEMDFAVRQVR